MKDKEMENQQLSHVIAMIYLLACSRADNQETCQDALLPVSIWMLALEQLFSFNTLPEPYYA